MTRKFSACAVLMLAVCALTAGSSQARTTVVGAEPASYDYSLKWNPRKRVLSGSGEIHVYNRGDYPMEGLWLRLRPNAGDQGDQPERISRVRGARLGERRAGGSMVYLKLLRPAVPGRYVRFSFRLRLKVGTENTSLGRSAGMNLFGDALPVVALNGPRGIRFGPEPSYGEGSFNDVASWSVRVRAPRGQRVLLPGTLYGIGSKGYRGSDYISHAVVRDFAFAIGRFSSLSKLVKGVRVEVIGADRYRHELPDALRRAVNVFSKMQHWYGGYELAALRVVVGNLPFGGSEYPGLVFSTPDNATIAHEVAHQWFYGIVGNDQYNDPFLDESLTAFSEQRFHKSYRCNLASPLDGRTHGLGTGMDYWEDHPEEYQQTIYRGGACALTVLRRDIGVKAFDRALRAYVYENGDDIARVDDFLEAVREAAPNYDLVRWEKLVGLR